LRERGIEGLVRLRVLVGADGRAREVKLGASSGWRLFDEAALAQARGCRFQPAREDGVAVDSWVEYPVRFALDTTVVRRDSP
jgi:protein TonB